MAPCNRLRNSRMRRILSPLKNKVKEFYEHHHDGGKHIYGYGSYKAVVIRKVNYGKARN